MEEFGYIYLIREREFLLREEDVYKVGATVQKTSTLQLDRLKKYKKGSQLLYTRICNAGIVFRIESKIKKEFRDNFNKHIDGYEYFIGNYQEMIDIINDVMNEKKWRGNDKMRAKTNTTMQITEEFDRTHDHLITQKRKINPKDIILDIIKKNNNGFNYAITYYGEYIGIFSVFAYYDNYYKYKLLVEGIEIIITDIINDDSVRNIIVHVLASIIEILEETYKKFVYEFRCIDMVLVKKFKKYFENIKDISLLHSMNFPKDFEQDKYDNLIVGQVLRDLLTNKKYLKYYCYVWEKEHCSRIPDNEIQYDFKRVNMINQQMCKNGFRKNKMCCITLVFDSEIILPINQKYYNNHLLNCIDTSELDGSMISNNRSNVIIVNRYFKVTKENARYIDTYVLGKPKYTTRTIIKVIFDEPILIVYKDKIADDIYMKFIVGDVDYTSHNKKMCGFSFDYRFNKLGKIRAEQVETGMIDVILGFTYETKSYFYPRLSEMANEIYNDCC